MCKVRILRTLVKQRLNVAVEEIFELFERTIAEYEEELNRSKEEKERQRQLLDALLNPHVRLHRADMQQVLVESQDEVLSAEPEGPVEPPQIKEEKEDVWSSRDEQQLPRQEEEADVNKFTFSGVHVKREEDEGASSQLRHSPSEGKREAAGNRHSPDNKFASLSDTADMMSPLSDTDHSDDAKEPSDAKGGKKRFVCSECGRTFAYKKTLKTHMIIHTGEKDFACSFCAKKFYRKCDMKIHMATHTDEKPFSCVICAKGFSLRKYLMIHMKTHTGEKPFTCSVCAEVFTSTQCLVLHARQEHSGEKTFSCHVCDKRFTHKKNMMIHLRTHTGEKAFVCDACGQRFSSKYQLDKHRCAGMDAAAVSMHSEATVKRVDELR
ncbi:zinc finger protein 350-like [Phyllopteryx taeniolatus]|uniref:zinc finger protein 350-like n=1 Tax=Phyllopteryx taeniolatus TaxID=161469 RepID=UPI002AD22A9F|nr:zinc finger protein 350-like [Phyllopteryx taeniolatus]